jgi:hypothetical protein
MVHILKDYVKPIMQLLTNDITDYNMRLIVTKCLNTAVMLVYLLLGDKGIKMANYCNTHTTRKRHMDGIDNNISLINSLKEDLLRTTKKRYIYYILLTDAHFPRVGTENTFFPGHVLVFEKVPANPKPYYYIYQSYINEYDLKGHYENNNNSIKKTYDEFAQLLEKLKYVLSADLWDDHCIEYWKDLTFVDTVSLKNSSIKNRFFLCYQRSAISTCIEKVQKYVIDKFRPLKYINFETNEVYGDVSKYDPRYKPLTKFEMKTKLATLIPELSKHKKYNK